MLTLGKMCSLTLIYMVRNAQIQQTQLIPKQALVFTYLLYKFLKTLWEKEKLLVTDNFSFHQIWNSLKFILLEKVIIGCLARMKLSLWLFSSLTNDKIFGLLKAFRDNVAKIKNIMEKKENVGNHPFLLSPATSKGDISISSAFQILSENAFHLA